MRNNSILDIKDILNDYSSDLQEAIAEEVKNIAIDAQKKLKATSPKSKKNSSRKGKYAKGWKVKEEKGNGYIKCTIYNSTDYQLTHLLENGHLTRNGKKTSPIKHIAPVHDECCEKFEKNINKIIKNGG